jgi:hypothetical protein
MEGVVSFVLGIFIYVLIIILSQISYLKLIAVYWPCSRGLMLVDGLLSSYNPNATQPLSGIRRSQSNHHHFFKSYIFFTVTIGALLKSFCDVH